MSDAFDADVLVVGAGASGIPAAIGAARAGARVTLIEEDLVPGGAPVDNYVAMPCGGPRTGIYREMVDRLNAEYQLPGRPRDKSGQRRGDWYLPSSYLAVIWEIIAAEKNLRLVCGARALYPIVEDDWGRPRVAGVVVQAPCVGERRIRAKVTIDATGTGAIAAMVGGCEVLYGRDAKSDFGETHAPEVADDMVQQCTWMYISQRLRPGPAFDMSCLDVVGMIDAGFGWFNQDPQECTRRNTGIYLHWGSAVRCPDTRDPMALADAQRQAYAAMERDIALLREAGYVVHLAPKLGVRESRRIVGEYVVTENDLRSGELPDDTIAIGTYGLDIWGENIPPEEQGVAKYGIPYRALVPKGVDDLLLAGKILSGSHVAMSAYRVQPIVASTGQAAGVAAALSCKQDVAARQLDPNLLRYTLREQGVDLSGTDCAPTVGS
jgi:hypothetical protein